MAHLRVFLMIFPYVCNQTSNLHAYMELLVYKASAGSGKTFTLAVEYIKLLILNHRAYRQILAVTFTNKATAEMKERILTQLYGIWKEDPASDAYLKRIKEDLAKKPETASLSDRELRQRAGMALQYMLHDYSRFRVETIDSFFQSVMRNLARELELSPNLNIELNNAEVLSDAVDSMIEKLTPSSPVLAWLLDYINERIADDKRWNVSNEVKSFGRNIFDESYIERGEGLRFKLRSPETIKLYRDVLREMETDALEQMKGFYDQVEGELEGHALVPEDLKGGARGIGSYFRKLRDGRLADKDVLNATLQNCLADAKNWATKTSSRKDEIIRLAETSLIPLLQDAERFRPQKNRTINSCRLSLQHLNKLQLLNHIDEEVRPEPRAQPVSAVRHQCAAAQISARRRLLFRIREDRRQHPQRNDRRVPGHKPHAMGQLPHAAARRAFAGSGQPHCGRCETVHIPLAEWRLGDIEQLGKRPV